MKKNYIFLLWVGWKLYTKLSPKVLFYNFCIVVDIQERENHKPPYNFIIILAMVNNCLTAPRFPWDYFIGYQCLMEDFEIAEFNRNNTRLPHNGEIPAWAIALKVTIETSKSSQIPISWRPTNIKRVYVYS